MLQAGLAVLIASLTITSLADYIHGSTACVCAASAATGGRNAPVGLAVLIARLTITSLADYIAAWLDSLHVCRKRGHRRQECSKQGSLFSSPV